MELEADDRTWDTEQAPQQLFRIDPRHDNRGVPPA